MSALESNSPRWTLPVKIGLLFWALAGVGAFYAQYSMGTDDIAKLPKAQQEMWGSMPGWAWAAYAIAVFAGLSGAVALLIKKSWAAVAFAISLIAVLVQFSYPFLIADGINRLGASGLAFPAFIIFMAAVQIWLSRNWRAKGWLG